LEFTPDAKEQVENADEAVREDYRDVDPSDADTIEKVQLIDELLDDPEVKQALLEQMEDE